MAAKNRAEQQPALNLQIARAYLAGSDSAMPTRTWRDALEALTDPKTGPTRERWLRAAKDPAYGLPLPKVITETTADLLLRVMKSGKVSTNIHLRRLHNFALDMGWLAWPVLPKKRWPAVRFKEKRAVTWPEHQAIVAGETNSERRAYYECCWHLGAGQTEVANLAAEDIDWQNKVVSFRRQKTGTPSIIRFGAELEAIFRSLPQVPAGLAFLSVATMWSTIRPRATAGEA